jgi:hypothetical protein
LVQRGAGVERLPRAPDQAASATFRDRSPIIKVMLVPSLTSPMATRLFG